MRNTGKGKNEDLRTKREDEGKVRDGSEGRRCEEECEDGEANGGGM